MIQYVQTKFPVIKGDVAIIGMSCIFPGAPDLAVEVLSPSERPADVHAKIGDYLEAGARLVWVIDPSRRQVRVHRTLLRPLTLVETAMLDGEDVLPGFSVQVARLFPE